MAAHEHLKELCLFGPASGAYARPGHVHVRWLSTANVHCSPGGGQPHFDLPSMPGCAASWDKCDSLAVRLGVMGKSEWGNKRRLGAAETDVNESGMASLREGSTIKMAAPRVTMRKQDPPRHSGRPAQAGTRCLKYNEDSAWRRGQDQHCGEGDPILEGCVLLCGACFCQT
jgi:hypothetical protein